MVRRGAAGTTAGVQPGDWFVVSPAEALSWWIEHGEALIDGKDSRWAHAGICSRIEPQPAPGQPRTVWIVEAEPGGAVERPWHWEDCPHLWSTGTGLSNPTFAPAAQSLKGTPYSFLDYLAIATHGLHIPAPGLKSYIASTGHDICSQLVDLTAQIAAEPVQLFNDGRWNGYVKPSDLGSLLEARLRPGVATR